MNFNKFFSELERRKVYRVVIGYGIVAWLIAQIAGLILGSFEAPTWIMKLIIILLLVGFPIAIVLSWIFDLSPEGIVKTEALKTGLFKEKKRITFKLAVSILSLITILSFVSWWSWKELTDEIQKPIQSLAILPFDNFTNDQDQEIVISGLQDNLITNISKIGALRVTPRPSTVRYKNSPKSSPEIAAELDVDAIIKAAILKFGDTIRINIQLIGISPIERNLWTESFEKPASEIYTLYNQVTNALAKEINLSLSVEEKTELSRAKVVNPQAYKAFITGKIHWDELTPTSLQKSLEYYRLSIKLDSSFLLPYLGIVNVWGGRKQMGLVSHEVAYSNAVKIINKAYGIEGFDKDGINATLSWMEWNWNKRELDFKNQLKINPSDATSHAFYANFLMIFKRFKEARFHTEEALKIDPFNNLVHGLNLTDLNKIELYDSVINIVISNDFHHPLARNALRESYFFSGKFDLAYSEEVSFAANVKRDIELVNALESGFNQGGYLMATHRAAEYLEERSKETFIPCSLIFKYYAKSGNKEKTLEWLEIGLEQRDAEMPYITVVHLYDFVRDEPRFKAILKKMNLPQS